MKFFIVIIFWLYFPALAACCHCSSSEFSPSLNGVTGGQLTNATRKMAVGKHLFLGEPLWWLVHINCSYNYPVRKPLMVSLVLVWVSCFHLLQHVTTAWLLYQLIFRFPQFPRVFMSKLLLGWKILRQWCSTQSYTVSDSALLLSGIGYCNAIARFILSRERDVSISSLREPWLCWVTWDILCLQIDREYAVQKALYSVGFPVPHPVLYCTDTHVIGTEFYIMEHVQVLIASKC